MKKEVQTIHLPIIFGAVLDLANVNIYFFRDYRVFTISQAEVERDSSKASTASIAKALLLLDIILKTYSGNQSAPAT